MSDNKTKKENVATVATSESQKQQVKQTKNKANKEAASSAVSPALDKFLWFLAFALIILAIAGNFYYIRFIAIDEGSLAKLGRVVAVIVVILAGLGVTLLTNKGKKLLAFARESYIELRKVVWPTRQEAMQTTLIVFVAVVLVSIFLYLCDIVFLQLVRAITL